MLFAPSLSCVLTDMQVTSEAEPPKPQPTSEPIEYPDCEVNPVRELDIELPTLAADLGTKEQPLDLIIVGCGPAGLGAADKASAKGLKVALVDPNPKGYWMNNYGVWVDEFEQLGLADCFTRQWDSARVVVQDGDDIDDEKDIILNRSYAQVSQDSPTSSDRVVVRMIFTAPTPQQSHANRSP